MTDQVLENKLSTLRARIISWAERHGIWQDACFKTWIEHFNDEPSKDAPALVLCADGRFLDIISNRVDNEIANEFDKLIDQSEFWYDWHDHTVAFFYPRDEAIQPFISDYVEWQWMCCMFTQDYVDVYSEFFDRIGKNPDELLRLNPRQYEQFLDAVLRNNGFRSILGPGSGDGGVDLRLYHKDSIGDVLTIVQAKRYAKNNPIDLVPVQALAGAMVDQNASRSLLVTTSRYLPSAKEFAARQSGRIVLAGSSEVSEWCKVASLRIEKDKSRLVSIEHLLDVIRTIRNQSQIHNVVVARSYRMGSPIRFAIVLKETKNAALLMSINSRIVSGDTQVGNVVPIIDETLLKMKDSHHVFRATKSVDRSGGTSYWGRQHLHFAWDGNPVHQDLMD